MPRETESIDLEETQRELRERYEDLEQRAEELDADDDGDDEGRQQVVQQAAQARRHFNAVAWLREEFDGDTVVVGALTTGERAQVFDRVDDLRAQRVSDAPGEPSVRNAAQSFYVAQGVVEAPFFDAEGTFDEQVAAVRDLPPPVTDWLNERVETVSSLPDALGNGSGG